MYHIVYLTRNLINGKIYVGVHQTYSLEDNYLGSGKMLQRAIAKYGRQNFERIIVHFCLTREDSMEWEKLIVDRNFINRQDVYNTGLGGYGSPGLTYEEMLGKEKADELKFLRSESFKKAHRDGKYDYSYNHNPVHRGKTYEEAYGPDKSAELKLKRSVRLKQTHADGGLDAHLNNPNAGGKITGNPIVMAKILETRLLKNPPVTCGFCGKTVDSINFNRWHGVKCKKHPDFTVRILPTKTCDQCGRTMVAPNIPRHIRVYHPT